MKRQRTASDWFSAGIALVVMGVFLVVGIVLIVHGISRHNTGGIVGGAFLAAIGGIVPVFLLYFGLQKAARGTRCQVLGAFCRPLRQCSAIGS